RADRALAIDDRNVPALTVRGRARTGLKDFDGAVADYESAIAADTSSAGLAYVALGWLHYSQDRRAEAESTFKDAVAALPDSVVVRLALANFYWVIHRPTEAEDALKEV